MARTSDEVRADVDIGQAIDAFVRGTGNIGIGQAAMCWVDLSRSYNGTGDMDDARRSATEAVDAALATDDPWVRQEAEAQLALVAPLSAAT